MPAIPDVLLQSNETTLCANSRHRACAGMTKEAAD